MRSAEDLKPAAVIREAAMRLFAERGAAAVTVRQIAAAAGVSPGLVMHHFGSKDGLREAVDRRAVAFFEEMISEFAGVGGEGAVASLAELFAARLEQEPAITSYLRRLLADGGDAADDVFTRLFDTTLAGMGALVAAGVARPAGNERIRAAFLLANDLALVLLRPQIARATGLDPLTRDGLAQWTAEVVDVYSGGVFVTPAGPGQPDHSQPDRSQPDSGQPPARQEDSDDSGH